MNKKPELIENILIESASMNISFNDLGIDLSINHIPDERFYDAFYKKFFDKYKDYDALPTQWKNWKIDTMNSIAKILPHNSKILSFGCGNGFIEKVLFEQRKDITLTAYDFSNIALKWLSELSPDIKVVNNINKLARYDVIYLTQVIYALTFASGVDLLSLLRSHLEDGGKIVIIDFSAIQSENGNYSRDKVFYGKKSTSMKKIIKSIFPFLVPLYQKLWQFKFHGAINVPMQFWGYQRNSAYIEKMLHYSNLIHTKTYSSSGQMFCIAKKGP